MTDQPLAVLLEEAPRIAARLRAARTFSRYHGDHLIEFPVTASAPELDAADALDRLSAALRAQVAEASDYKADALRLHVDKMRYFDALLELSTMRVAVDAPQSEMVKAGAQMAFERVRSIARAALHPEPEKT
jgi:hypothetical protein